MSDLFRGKMHERLVSLFDGHHVVVWRDASGVMAKLFEQPGVLPDSVTMPAFHGNPLSVRAPLDRDDPWIERKWLLYVPPLPDGVECDWLLDYERGFKTVADGSFSSMLSAFFGMVATPALQKALAGPVAEELALHFAEYLGGRDRLDEGDVLNGLLRAAVRQPAADWPDLLLRYLASPSDRDRWDTAGLLPTLTLAIRDQLGLRRHLTVGHPPDVGALCRCMVASALVRTESADAKRLANHLPQEANRETWRATLDRGLRDPQLGAALLTAIEQGLQGSDLFKSLDDPSRLAAGPALRLIDRQIERLLIDRRPEEPQTISWCQEVSSVAATRLQHKALDEEVRSRWGAISAGAELVVAARHAHDDLANLAVDAFDELAAAYVASDDGDWQLDALYRRLPQSEAQLGPEWAALIERAQVEYHRWVRALTARWTKALNAKAKYAAPGFINHTDFWSALIEGAGRVAVLYIDALRADLAYELKRMLEQRGREVRTQPALAQLPTRTEVGMAALLPRASGNFSVEVEDGKLVSYIEHTRLPGVDQRSKFLVATLATGQRKVERRQVEEFLAQDGALITRCAAQGALPIAYTTDIDEGGPMAAKADFKFFLGRLEVCAQFIDRALFAGFAQVVVGADHGFLVRDPNAAPAGVAGTASSAGGFVRGLRYAAGSGIVSDGLIHLSAQTLGRGGADVFVPQDNSCLAVQGGAGPFLHGGLSLQECVLVFLSVLPGKRGATKPYVTIRLAAPERATTLTFKISLSASAVSEPILFAGRKVTVRVFDAHGGLVWQLMDPMMFYVGPAASKELLVAVPRAGGYRVSLFDAETLFPIATSDVTVDVLGGGFDF